MKPVSLARRFLFDPENRQHGLQIVSAIVVTYLVSSAVGLPENFWAVMSALIVMRPNMSSTLDAGWDRVRSTLLGALCGLLGVGLAQFGVAALVATLGVVSLLAYVSAAVPALRGAPVAALIVLSSSGLVGHPALQVALLRVVQIVIGVGVAMAISSVASRYRAADRLTGGCARMLRGAAARLARAQTRPTEAQAQANGERVRKALERLSALAASADKASRFSWRAAAHSNEQYFRRIAALTGRILQDVAMLNRIMPVDPKDRDEGIWREVAAVAGAALANIANVVEGQAEADLARLRQMAGRPLAAAREGHGQQATTSSALVAAPLHLLALDLQQLGHCVRQNPSHAA